MAAGDRPTGREAEAQMAGFIGKFDVAHQRLITSVRKALRARLPGAFELVYDNYNFFVIGYSASARPSESIVSIVAGANGVSLCFIEGASLPDPHRVLLGSGQQTRFVRLPSVEILDRPEIAALLDAAVAQAGVTFARDLRGTLIIRSISAKQRPRRCGSEN